MQLADGAPSQLQGRAVILAAGSVPRTIPGFDRGGPIMTSDEVLMLDYVPARVAVIGGGAIGCEFASTFADLGAAVTILEGLPKILPGLDADVANVVVRSFRKKNIDIKTGVTVTGHTPHRSAAARRCTSAKAGDENLDVDVVIVSVGRRPVRRRARPRAAPAVKVSDRGFVEVDEYCRTGEPGVYAIGDLINTPQLAHVGYAEAILVVKQLLGESPMPVAYDRVPWAIYCHPEVAWAGPGEEAAIAAGLRRRRRQAPVPRQQPGPDHRRARRAGEGHRQEERRRSCRAGARRAHGRPVGDRAAERRLPRRQLGGHRRRGRRVHPAAPELDRAVR